LKAPAVRQPRLRWWKEVLIIAVFYGLYSAVRDINGDNTGNVAQARHNARRIISLERRLHVFHEAQIQHWFLSDRIFIKVLDAWYGTAHFIAVAVVLLLLFFRYQGRYRLWRNTLAWTTGLALIGFFFFPLLPPRLLPHSYHFVDTLVSVGGLWSFSNGPVNDVSNQFAAMPSLHTGWSTWCALAVIPIIRPLWGKLLMALYPCFTVFCIVVTANHYFADAAGGLVALAAGYGLARLTIRVTDAVRSRRPAKAHARSR
jgi:PAP2 superfamily